MDGERLRLMLSKPPPAEEERETELEKEDLGKGDCKVTRLLEPSYNYRGS